MQVQSMPSKEVTHKHEKIPSTKTFGTVRQKVRDENYIPFDAENVWQQKIAEAHKDSPQNISVLWGEKIFQEKWYSSFV